VLPHKQIELRLQAAVRDILTDADVSIVLVRPCPDPKFGDYQSNALMSLAKTRKMNPRQLAENVLAKLDVSDICEKVEIAGAGFLNFRLKNSALTQTLEAAVRGEHLFFEIVGQASSLPETAKGKAGWKPAPLAARTVVIDCSSPNVAKPMHVGHIRSTILGDSLARAMRLLGHRVVTDNHIGDWGTQFGMLIAGATRKKQTAPAAGEALVAWSIMSLAGVNISETSNPIEELERIYKLMMSASQGDQKALDYINSYIAPNSLTPKIHDKDSVLNWARSELVKLQQGDWTNTHIWKELIDISKRQFDTIYSRLGVKFDETLGESFYSDRLKPLVDELLTKNIACESEGAIAIFFDEAVPAEDERYKKLTDFSPEKNKEVGLSSYRDVWSLPPALIRKSDGGFNYTTTDLATLAYRLEKWNPDEIIYVTDGRQQLHFQQIFAAFKKWHGESKTKLAHVWFGSILGEDGKPFKTRSGETVKLSDLLDEAEEHAFKIVSEKNPNLPDDDKNKIARVVGIGAVKYADLLPNRQSDYVFSWDKMLALQGNTAPYLLYAYARIKSIFRKLENPESRIQNPELKLAAPEEIALAKHLLNFGLTLEAVAEEYRPNFLCNYLFELAGKFTGFYENCPVLKSEGAVRDSRLALCDLTARVLKLGLETLGIETVEQM
jgi:arginyl-tRNA synthetase